MEAEKIIYQIRHGAYVIRSIRSRKRRRWTRTVGFVLFSLAAETDKSFDDNYPSHTIEVSCSRPAWSARILLVRLAGYRRCVHSSVRARGTLVIVRSPGPLNKIRATGRAVCQFARGCCLSVTLTWEDAAWFHPRSSATTES